jgi:hypothetical protein
MRKSSFIIFFTFLSQICFSQYNLDSTSANTIQLSGYVLRKKANKVKLVDTDTLIVWTSYGFGFAAGMSKFEFNINRQAERSEIDINLVAITLTYWVDRLFKKLRSDAAVAGVEGIGTE